MAVRKLPAGLTIDRLPSGQYYVGCTSELPGGYYLMTFTKEGGFQAHVWLGCRSDVTLEPPTFATYEEAFSFAVLRWEELERGKARATPIIFHDGSVQEQRVLTFQGDSLAMVFQMLSEYTQIVEPDLQVAEVHVVPATVAPYRRAIEVRLYRRHLNLSSGGTSDARISPGTSKA